MGEPANETRGRRWLQERLGSRLLACWGATPVVTIHLAKTFQEIVDAGYQVIAVDIPIGLPEIGTRNCEPLARRLIEKSGNAQYQGNQKEESDIIVMFDRLLRIHGDNILECERAMGLLAEALDGGVSWHNSSPYCPEYRLTTGQETIHLQLFAGYDRWSFDLKDYLRSIGASLKEATDAVVTELTKDDIGSLVETVILSFEFCGALPAGNNAWQRCGRAIAMAKAGVPYVYYAELGGFELDADRQPKAARQPNPLVPFGYLTLGSRTGTPILPIFTPSPSITEGDRRTYGECFSENDALDFIRAVLKGEDVTQARKSIESKGARLLEILADTRKVKDSLKARAWTELLTLGESQVIEKLIRHRLPWKKKLGLDTLTPTFLELSERIVECGSLAAGSSSMPLCILPPEGRKKLRQALVDIYGERLSTDFLEWVEGSGTPLALVWIAGFKPKGDDSRPDRGLVPLTRMALGFEVDLLTVVYGPAKEEAWKTFEADPGRLMQTNGLWEAILSLSNAVLVDSPTEKDTLSSLGVLTAETQEKQRLFYQERRENKQISLSASTTPLFGEHDVDSVLHLLFSQKGSMDFMESLCNPPGGDWSGMSYFDTKNEIEYRWTSLPRVSGAEYKRPDHIVLSRMPGTSDNVIIAIESKDKAGAIEANIGPRLVDYVRKLHAIAPNISRKLGSADDQWRHSAVSLDFRDTTYISGAAYRHEAGRSIEAVAAHAKTDITVAVEFRSDQESVRFHVLLCPTAEWLLPLMQSAAQNLDGRFEVQVHGLNHAVQ